MAGKLTIFKFGMIFLLDLCHHEQAKNLSLSALFVNQVDTNYVGIHIKAVKEISE